MASIPALGFFDGHSHRPAVRLLLTGAIITERIFDLLARLDPDRRFPVRPRRRWRVLGGLRTALFHHREVFRLYPIHYARFMISGAYPLQDHSVKARVATIMMMQRGSIRAMHGAMPAMRG